MQPESPKPPESTVSSDENTRSGRERDLPPLYTEEAPPDPHAENETRRLDLEFPRSLAILIAIPISLLPRSWQERYPLSQFPIRVGGIITGSVQLLASMALALHFYRQYYAETVTGQQIGAIARATPNDQTPVMVMGFTVLFSFIFLTLKGWFVVFFSVEGMARIMSCAAGQPRGTTPVAIVGKILDIVKRRSNDAIAAATLVADRVSADGELMGVRIETCRRRDWGKRDALAIDGALFKLVSYRSEDQGLRRHLYFLEPSPSWFEPDRTIDYTPELVLDEGHKGVEA